MLRFMDALLEFWMFPSLGARRRLALDYDPNSDHWSIWKERNANIFVGTSLEFSELLEKVKWSLCVWLCTSKDFKDLKVGDLLQSWEGCMSASPPEQKNRVEWSPPPNGYFKFNVDGASRGKPGPARIGGVLRDELRVTRVVF